MLDQGTTWSDVSNIINPTKSVSLNHIIRRMRKMEAARHSKPFQACRALCLVKFGRIIVSLGKLEDKKVRTWLSAYPSYVYIMITWVDDTAKFHSPYLKPYVRHNAKIASAGRYPIFFKKTKKHVYASTTQRAGQTGGVWRGKARGDVREKGVAEDGVKAFVLGRAGDASHTLALRTDVGHVGLQGEGGGGGRGFVRG